MKKILNVGCGNDTYGTDFVDLYPSRKEVKKCNLDKEKLPFRSGIFDEVYSRSLLEHLRNPGFAIAEMYRVLKGSGKIIIQTDNASFVFYHIKGRLHYGKYEEHARTGGGRVGGGSGKEDRHYSLFTSWHLENHLKSVGFGHIKCSYMLWAHPETPMPRNYKNIVIAVIYAFSKKLGGPTVRAEAIKPK